MKMDRGNPATHSERVARLPWKSPCLHVLPMRATETHGLGKNGAKTESIDKPHMPVS